MIRNEKGFTLIELMVVVLIIGILVAIAIPVFNGTANNAKDKACTANVRTIAGAVAQHQAEDVSGAYPADVDELVTDGYLKDPPPVDPHGAYDYSIDPTTGVVSADNANHDPDIRTF